MGARASVAASARGVHRAIQAFTSSRFSLAAGIFGVRHHAHQLLRPLEVATPIALRRGDHLRADRIAVERAVTANDLARAHFAENRVDREMHGHG